ncbi:MAG: hypothetical protein QOI76_1083 [Frankiales bacterium]|jgi:hypothetical protein|nr:hypothetical protein [Frankiales bacterium]
MTDQESTAGRGLEQAASDNSPAANQRAGEALVGPSGEADREDTAARSAQSVGPVHAEPRHRGGSSAGSSAAAAGEVPVPPVEKTQDDAAGETDSATHDRPVTGVHRPSAPSGEVAPQ